MVRVKHPTFRFHVCLDSGIPSNSEGSTRFDQVEGVSDRERDAAWKRIRAAARKYGVEIEARGWRRLFKGGKAKKG